MSNSQIKVKQFYAKISGVNKKWLIIGFCLLVFSSCSEGQVSVQDFGGDSAQNLAQDSGQVFDQAKGKNILIIVGEGGPSQSLFIKAADTYKRENDGEVYEVHSGDDFISAVRDFVDIHGKIDHLEYFGHGNEVGLYVNQAPGVNGGLYANDPELNRDYVAASIYELPNDIFSEYGWIKFNGCNVASGYPEKNSLAQSFANYFDVDTVAPMGPTEFSSSPYGINPIEGGKYLEPDFDKPVYMVSTYADKGFTVLEPQKESKYFKDVREGQAYFEAVEGLYEKGLNLGFKDGEFLPYKNISYAEAKEFCRIATGDIGKCKEIAKDEGWWIRNLKALKMLMDAFEIQLKYTNPWYNSYIYWANQKRFLTDDFINRKWYTRGEMAELTWNFIRE